MRTPGSGRRLVLVPGAAGPAWSCWPTRTPSRPRPSRRRRSTSPSLMSAARRVLVRRRRSWARGWRRCARCCLRSSGPVAEALATSGSGRRSGGVPPTGRGRAGRVRPRRRGVHGCRVGSDRAAPHEPGLAAPATCGPTVRPDSSAAWTMTGWAHQVDGQSRPGEDPAPARARPRSRERRRRADHEQPPVGLTTGSSSTRGGPRPPEAGDTAGPRGRIWTSAGRSSPQSRVCTAIVRSR